MATLQKLRPMDKIELNFAINELKKAEQGYLKKIYLHENGLFRIRIGEFSILAKPGFAAWLAENFEEKSIENGFITRLRDKLSNRFVQKIYLKDGDRILVFEFNDLYLIIELFAKGNIILTEKEMRILESWRKTDKKTYEFKAEPFDLDYYYSQEEEKSLGAVLSRMLGKKYKDCIAKKLNLNEKTLLSKIKKEKIEDEIKNLMKNAKPCILKEGEKILDFALLEDAFETNAEKTETLGKACSLYYLQKIDAEKIRAEKSAEKIKMKIEIYKTEEIESRKKAEWVKKNLEIVEEIIQAYSKKDKNEDLEKKLETLGIKIGKIDKKNKTVEIEVEF